MDVTGRAPTWRTPRTPGPWVDLWAHPPGVKVCGLTRREDVRLAAEGGAWAVGFIFARSPRQVTIAQAQSLVADLRSAFPAGSGPLAVGVFQDMPPEYVSRVVCEVELDAVQLHGEESPYQVQRICAAAEEALVIKVIAVDHGTAAAAGILARAQVIAPHVDAVLLDSRVRDRVGGTGVSFRWELARPAAAYVPVLVAGGIGPGNVRAALHASGAWGVDVCSGVEKAPGIKDESLLGALFAEVRAGRDGAAVP